MGRPRPLFRAVAYRGPPRGDSRRRPPASGTSGAGHGSTNPAPHRRPHPDPAPPQHQRQEHRAHEDQPDRKREHRRDRRRHRRRLPGSGRPRPGASRWSSWSRRRRRTRSPGTWAAATSSRRASGTSATCPATPPTCPAEHKGAAWARLGVDVDNSFEPLYVVSPDRKQQVSRLKQLVKGASEVYLATDEDREGEAIAWHLVDTLKPRVPVHRMVFHEITPEAIARAVANPRELDTALVDAQETRRILDRLYGYEVSARSSGRRCCRSCRPGACSPWRPGSWSSASGSAWRSTPPTTGPSRAPSPSPAAPPRPTRASRRRSAPSWSASTTAGSPPASDFDPATGRVTGEVVHLDEAGARGLAARLEGRQVTVSRVDEKPYRRRPYAPVHDLDAADGRRPQARLVLGADHAGGAAAVRERPHHLHAYRLDEPLAGGDQRSPPAGPRALRRRLRAGRGPPLQEQGQGRAGGARGDPPGR